MWFVGEEKKNKKFWRTYIFNSEVVQKNLSYCLKIKKCSFCIFSAMAVDVLVMQEAQTSVAMVSSYSSQNILIPALQVSLGDLFAIVNVWFLSTS